MTTAAEAHVAKSLAEVRSRIERACASSGRDPAGIRILAVTKGFGPDAPAAAIAAGLTDVGENYYQEAAEKFPLVSWPAGVRRHFIGRVQRNKAARIAGLFDVVQTVDDLAIARALDRTATDAGSTLDVLVQLNVARDQRQGVAPSGLADFVEALRATTKLRLRGLMVVGPRDSTATGEAFGRARESFDDLRRSSPECDTLSMGMSDDLELAVAAGSTMLRIGTALFGTRPATVKLV